jgi:hypothetical protein
LQALILKFEKAGNYVLEAYILDPGAIISVGSSLFVFLQHGQVAMQDNIIVLSKRDVELSKLACSYSVVPFTVVDIPIQAIHFQGPPSSGLNIHHVIRKSKQLWDILSESTQTAGAWYKVTATEPSLVKSPTSDLNGSFLDLTGRGGVDGLNAVLGKFSTEAFVVVQDSDTITPGHDFLKYYPAISNIHVCIHRMEHYPLYNDINNVLGHLVEWSAVTLKISFRSGVSDNGSDCLDSTKSPTSPHDRDAYFTSCEEVLKVAFALSKVQIGVVLEISLPLSDRVHGEKVGHEGERISINAADPTLLAKKTQRLLALILWPLGVDKTKLRFWLSDENLETMLVWVPKPAFLNESYVNFITSTIITESQNIMRSTPAKLMNVNRDTFGDEILGEKESNHSRKLQTKT